MAFIVVNEKTNFDVALRRFKRSCEKSGKLSRLRETQYHEKRTSKRKRQRAAAVKRHLKRLAKEQENMERDRGRY